MFWWNECFYAFIGLACDSQRHERLLGICHWFTSNHIPFRFGWPREASRLEAKTHEAEAKTHEAEAEAEATTHEAEAEAEARFFGLEAEARPRGLTSLLFFLFFSCFITFNSLRHAYSQNGWTDFYPEYLKRRRLVRGGAFSIIEKYRPGTLTFKRSNSAILFCLRNFDRHYLENGTR